ncbi:MAG: hypothetical protein J6Z11_14645, partial [Candidatus Riflebacteria bacterium]|nr:hypothetical protein [Candidatus Riflebacteria bacterium]
MPPYRNALHCSPFSLAYARQLPHYRGAASSKKTSSRTLGHIPPITNHLPQSKKAKAFLQPSYAWLLSSMMRCIMLT